MQCSMANPSFRGDAAASNPESRADYCEIPGLRLWRIPE